MLWDAIRRGVIDTIGTDHTAFPMEAKLDPTQTILDKRMGQNTIQDYPPMMFSQGVCKGRISLEQMVAVTSTNAAKIFGMYPRKCGDEDNRHERRHNRGEERHSIHQCVSVGLAMSLPFRLAAGDRPSG
jgi:dihydroorotase-like cyclic amidohydrolase